MVNYSPGQHINSVHQILVCMLPLIQYAKVNTKQISLVDLLQQDYRCCLQLYPALILQPCCDSNAPKKKKVAYKYLFGNVLSIHYMLDSRGHLDNSEVPWSDQQVVSGVITSCHNKLVLICHEYQLWLMPLNFQSLQK